MKQKVTLFSSPTEEKNEIIIVIRYLIVAYKNIEGSSKIGLIGVVREQTHTHTY